MPWSIFTQGGGNSVAVGWAKQLLQALGAPDTPGNETFIYQWEKAEGGGGKYNPLNQGPVPGHPELTSTGQQYGGGAADYVSWNAGVTGAADYINMSSYRGVKAGLLANNPTAARTALWDSPWASSHYGHGSAWPNVTLPGGPAILPASGSSGVPSVPGVPNVLNPSEWVKGFANVMGVPDLKDLFQRLGLIILGGVLVLVGIKILSGDANSEITQVVSQASGGGTPSAAGGTGKTGGAQRMKPTAAKAAAGDIPVSRVITMAAKA